MEIRLDQLEEQHFKWDETFQVSPAEMDQPDVAALGEIRCRGTIDRTTEGWVLRILVSYPQTLRCVRCLEPVEAPVDIDTAMLLMLGKGGADSEHELDRDDLGVVRLEQPKIDTQEIAREQMQLAVPMKPLCREECAGLCGSCGQNLNEGTCACKPEVDVRWAALQSLRSVN